MKKSIHLILLVIFFCKTSVVFGSTTIQKDTITETFEDYSTNSAYANIVRNLTNCKGLKWTIVNGNINNLKETQTIFRSTKGVILQSNGSAAVSKAPSITSGKLCNLTSIHWYAGRSSSSSLQMALYYSKDSVKWIKDTTTLFLTTERREYVAFYVHLQIFHHKNKNVYFCV